MTPSRSNTPPVFPVYLERRDATQRMARFYWIGVEPTLFGDWALVRRWGRIGTHGQCQEQWFATRTAARAAAHEALVRKQRRGYQTPVTWCRVNRPGAFNASEQSAPIASSHSMERRNPAAYRQYEFDLG